MDANYAFGYLVSKGVPAHVAAGIVGNLAVESSNFHPNVISGKKRGDNGTAYYAAQWRDSRKNAFETFAAASGRKPGDLDAQLDFVLEEMDPRSPYADAIAVKNRDRIMAADTIEDATSAFSRYYERPGTPHLSRRTAAARSVARSGPTMALPAEMEAPPSRPTVASLERPDNRNYSGPSFGPGQDLEEAPAIETMITSMPPGKATPLSADDFAARFAADTKGKLSPTRPDNFSFAGPKGMGGPGGLYMGRPGDETALAYDDVPEAPAAESVFQSVDRGTAAPSPGVPSGMEAISSLFNAPEGSRAISRGDSRISFDSLGDGRVSMTNQHGYTRPVSSDEYNHPSQQKATRDPNAAIDRASQRGIAGFFGGKGEGGKSGIGGSLIGMILGGVIGGPMGATIGGKLGGRVGRGEGIGGFFSSLFGGGNKGGGFPSAPADPSHTAVSPGAAKSISEGKGGLF